MGRNSVAKRQPTTHRARTCGRICSATLSAVASFGILAATAAPGALPSWGDTTTTLLSGPSSPGVVDLQLGGKPESGGNRASVDLALDALVPGGSRAILVTLANAGDATFTYSATATSAPGGSGGDLSPALRFSFVVGGTLAGGSRGSCIGGTRSFGPSRLTVSPRHVIPITHSSSPLLPGQTQSICIVVALPEDTGNSAQGDSAEATVVFRAAQVT